MEVVILSFEKYYSESRDEWSRMYWDFRKSKTNDDIYDSVIKNSNDIQRILRKLGLESALEEE